MLKKYIVVVVLIDISRLAEVLMGKPTARVSLVIRFCRHWNNFDLHTNADFSNIMKEYIESNGVLFTVCTLDAESSSHRPAALYQRALPMSASRGVTIDKKKLQDSLRGMGDNP